MPTIDISHHEHVNKLNVQSPTYVPPTMQWTYDLVVDVVAGLGRLPLEDAPCDEPYPCDGGWLDGVEWNPAVVTPVTLQPVRPQEYFAREDAGKEAGRHLHGFGFTRDAEGFLVPWFATIPDYAQPPVVSRGYFFRQGTNDPTELVEDGMVAIGVALPAPIWIEAMFTNTPPLCGGET